MFATKGDTEPEEESPVWDILCDKCEAKAETIMEEWEASSLLTIPIEEYGLCPGCVGRLSDAFDRLQEVED